MGYSNILSMGKTWEMKIQISKTGKLQAWTSYMGFTVYVYILSNLSGLYFIKST